MGIIHIFKTIRSTIYGFDIQRSIRVVRPISSYITSFVGAILERKYGGDESAVPTIDYLAVQSKVVPKTLPGITRTEVGNLVTYLLEVLLICTWSYLLLLILLLIYP